MVSGEPSGPVVYRSPQDGGGGKGTHDEPTMFGVGQDASPEAKLAEVRDIFSVCLRGGIPKAAIPNDLNIVSSWTPEHRTKFAEFCRAAVQEGYGRDVADALPTAIAIFREQFITTYLEGRSVTELKKIQEQAEKNFAKIFQRIFNLNGFDRPFMKKLNLDELEEAKKKIAFLIESHGADKPHDQPADAERMQIIEMTAVDPGDPFGPNRATLRYCLHQARTYQQMADTEQKPEIKDKYQLSATRWRLLSRDFSAPLERDAQMLPIPDKSKLSPDVKDAFTQGNMSEFSIKLMNAYPAYAQIPQGERAYLINNIISYISSNPAAIENVPPRLIRQYVVPYIFDRAQSRDPHDFDAMQYQDIVNIVTYGSTELQDKMRALVKGSLPVPSDEVLNGLAHMFCLTKAQEYRSLYEQNTKYQDVYAKTWEKFAKKFAAASESDPIAQARLAIKKETASNEEMGKKIRSMDQGRPRK